jgi:hypothetical protein
MGPKCHARALAGTFTLPHSTIKCGTTTECCAPASQKVYIDSGDSYMYICAEHLQAFKNRSSADPLGWLGWFDCSYPPGSQVKYSDWYWQTVLEIFRAQASSQAHKDAFVTPGFLRVWMEKEIAAAAAAAAEEKQMKMLTKSLNKLSVS